MNRERLTEIFFDQKETFNSKKGLIDRDINLTPYIKTSQIVVITGVRRCGKSSLLFLIKQKMQLNDDEYCYFNFDDERILNEPELLEQIDNLHKECDFVVKQGLDIIEAIQVTYNLNKENFNRETEGLLEAVEKFNLKKGLLLYYNSEISSEDFPERIQPVPIWKYLSTDYTNLHK